MTSGRETRPRGADRSPTVRGLGRRDLLGRLAGLGLLLASGGSGLVLGCSRSEPACYDPELLSTAERSARKLRGYVDRSPEGEAKRCGGCAFFSAAEREGCGRCSILAGPVSVMGLCDAWSERETG